MLRLVTFGLPDVGYNPSQQTALKVHHQPPLQQHSGLHTQPFCCWPGLWRCGGIPNPLERGQGCCSCVRVQPAASAANIKPLPTSAVGLIVSDAVVYLQHGCCAVQRRKEMKQQLGLPEDYGIDNSDSEQGELPLYSGKHSTCTSRALSMQPAVPRRADVTQRNLC